MLRLLLPLLLLVLQVVLTSLDVACKKPKVVNTHNLELQLLLLLLVLQVVLMSRSVLRWRGSRATLLRWCATSRCGWTRLMQR
jgi:hypothetical protein